jgi:hypothetical protein
MNECFEFFILFTLVHITKGIKINITAEYDTSLNIISYLNNNYTIPEIHESEYELGKILLYIFISICKKHL